MSDDDRKKPFKPARGFGSRPDGEGERPSRGGDKPFRKPRSDAGPGGEKRAFGDRKPFAARSGAGGDRPPFKDRPERGERSGFKSRPERGSERKDGDRSRPQLPAAENVMDGERIAKRLARAGISSRREAEALIADGRVKVNGVVLDSPARNVTAEDRIELDNKPIPAIERTRLFLFHKPAGVVTTNRDPEGRRTVFDVLPGDLPRLLTVGRLDINTEGLLLLTNDGGLARVLELPSTGWLRRYRVRVHGTVDEAKLADLKNGIAVDGIFYGAIEASLDREQGSNAWLTLAFREGKNREVKNVLGALGLEVSRLIRISFGPFQLGELPEGAVHELKGRYLRDQLGDRLIEESAAVFDLPERQGQGRAAQPQAEPAPERRAEPQNRRREREDRRSDALERLDTRPKSGFGRGKPAGGKGERREPEPPRGRSANVWMAPGARPMGKKKSEAPEEAERPARSTRPQREGAGEGGRFRCEGSRPQGDRPDRDRTAPGRPFNKREGEDRASARPRFEGARDRSAGDAAGEARPPRKHAKPFGAARDGGADGQPRRERPAGGFSGKPGGRPPFKDDGRGPRKFGKPADKAGGEGRPPRRDDRPDRPRPALRPGGGGPRGGGGGKGGPRGSRS